MRLIFCLFALLLLRLPLAAQPGRPTPPPGAAADSGAVLVFNNWYLPRYQATAASGADTTGALLSLFRKRRYAGFLYFIPYTVGMCLALPISTTDSQGQQHKTGEAISPPLGSMILAATVVGFIVHANRFNKSHLLAIDRGYAAGQPIPARYRRLLSDRHFAEAALLRTGLAQQMAREQASSPTAP